MLCVCTRLHHAALKKVVHGLTLAQNTGVNCCYWNPLLLQCVGSGINQCNQTHLVWMDPKSFLPLLTTAPSHLYCSLPPCSGKHNYSQEENLVPLLPFQLCYSSCGGSKYFNDPASYVISHLITFISEHTTILKTASQHHWSQIKKRLPIYDPRQCAAT